MGRVATNSGKLNLNLKLNYHDLQRRLIDYRLDSPIWRRSVISK